MVAAGKQCAREPGACSRRARAGVVSTRGIAALAIGLALSAMAAWGQPAQVPRKVLLYFEPAGSPDLPREDAVYLYATLLTRLHAR